MSHVCDDCGRAFDTSHGLSIHETTGHDEPYKRKDVLERLYHDEGLTQQEIADRFDLHRGTIHKWIGKLDIETDWRGDPTRPVNHQFFNRPDRGVGNEYERVRTYIGDKLYTVKVHRLIAVAHGKLPPEDLFNRDIAVHHESSHGLDNRPGNLEVMTHSEHTSHHNDLRKGAE